MHRAKVFAANLLGAGARKKVCEIKNPGENTGKNKSQAIGRRMILTGIVVLAFALLTAAVCGKSGFGEAKEQISFSGASGPLSAELIRIHVIANSDAEADQRLKYRVRDAVLEVLMPEMARAGSAEESRQILREKLAEVREKAQQTVREAGFPYAVRTEWGTFSFPARFYGEIAFPAGSYEAVRIVIGEGQGANWWCVLYPPLCFIGPVAVPTAGAAAKSGGEKGSGLPDKERNNEGDKAVPQNGQTEKRQEGSSEVKTGVQGRESLWPAMTGATPESEGAVQPPSIELRSKLWEWCKNWFL